MPAGVPEDDGAAGHLVRGLALPDIALAATTGATINLSRLEGEAIVFAYPWTGRPGLADPPNWDDIAGAHGSTPQTAAFRDRYAQFQALGIEVFGLGTQSGEHQRELVARLGVPFVLLSDSAFAFQQALALPTFETGGLRYLKRLSLLVRDGVIERVFHPVHPPEAHADEVLGVLQAARSEN
jgi:peroxiredoxin